jgi:hypothetical protein
MLPVLGKPIIIRLMDRLREAGIGYFVVVVDEHEGGIASYLNSSWVPNVRVKIVIQPSPRGTADALRCAASAIYGPFLLAACDTLVPTEHIPVECRPGDIRPGSRPANYPGRWSARHGHQREKTAKPPGFGSLDGQRLRQAHPELSR